MDLGGKGMMALILFSYYLWAIDSYEDYIILNTNSIPISGVMGGEVMKIAVKRLIREVSGDK